MEQGCRDADNAVQQKEVIDQITITTWTVNKTGELTMGTSSESVEALRFSYRKRASRKVTPSQSQRGMQFILIEAQAQALK